MGGSSNRLASTAALLVTAVGVAGCGSVDGSHGAASQSASLTVSPTPVPTGGLTATLSDEAAASPIGDGPLPEPCRLLTGHDIAYTFGIVVSGPQAETFFHSKAETGCLYQDGADALFAVAYYPKLTEADFQARKFYPPGTPLGSPTPVSELGPRSWGWNFSPDQQILAIWVNGRTAVLQFTVFADTKPGLSWAAGVKLAETVRSRLADA
jgi:hypothetical protein